MGLMRFDGCPKALVIALQVFMAGMPLSLATAEEPALTDASMTQAIGYFGVLAGRDLSADDAAWLKRQWREEFETTPQAIASQVDELAFGLELHRRDKDPLALAQSRAAVLTNIYCSSAQTSDPAVRRLRDILTPDDLVLAADCLLGLAVTRFDVDGLVASHALLASVAGQSHDADGDRAEVIAAIENGFAAAAPAEKAALANGELRHAVLARYWSRIEGSQQQRAFVDQVRKVDLTDLRSPARQFEALALRSLDAVDYLAMAGDAKLTGSAIGSYSKWLRRIAGYDFAIRDRDWLQQAIVDEFRSDPAKSLREVAGIEEMNRNYVLADSKEEKAALVERWAAMLYCYGTASSDANERRLVDVVFRHDPVVKADCEAERVKRESDQVIAEADGRQLREGDLDPSVRFARMMLARPLSPGEEAIIREDNIKSFQEDPEAWREEDEQIRAVLAKVERHQTDLFLAMDARKNLFDPIYCSLKDSDEPYADDYLAMFRKHGAIVHEDCANQVVTTSDEIEAFVGFSNFLALLNGRPPFDEAATEEIRQSVASLDLDGVESAMLAVKEWWSLLSLEEKIAEAEKVREKGITPEGDGSNVDFFIKLVKLKVVGENSRRRACLVNQVINEGQVALFAARSGGFLMDRRGGELGVPGTDLENIVFTSTIGAFVCEGL